MVLCEPYVNFLNSPTVQVPDVQALLQLNFSWLRKCVYLKVQRILFANYSSYNAATFAFPVSHSLLHYIM